MKHSPLPTHAHAQLDINFQSQEHSLQQGSKQPCEQNSRRWNEKILNGFQQEMRVFHHYISESTLLGHSEQTTPTFYNPEH